MNDLQARRVACDWHGGGGSALYAFCSTGAIDTARADHDLNQEIEECRSSTDGGNYIGSKLDDRDLQSLADYVQEKGSRGPVPGWSDLNW